jgi:YHS domain-containing protein
MWIRIILALIGVYVVIKVLGLVQRHLAGRRSRDEVDARPQQPPPSEMMVRDPVCGMYVTADHAMSIVHGGRRVYFCSPACRRKFTEGHE